jgi:hypothetical protein
MLGERRRTIVALPKFRRLLAKDFVMSRKLYRCAALLLVLVWSGVGCAQDPDSAAKQDSGPAAKQDTGKQDAGKLVTVPRTGGAADQANSTDAAPAQQSEGPALGSAHGAETRQAAKPTTDAGDATQTTGGALDAAAVATSELDALQQELTALRLRVEALEAEADASKTTIKNLTAQLAELDSRSERSVAAGRGAAAQDASDQPETRTAARVDQGRLIIDNRTGVEQQIYINGMLWRAPPGRAETEVAVGEVTTQLAPWESAKRWDAGQWKTTEAGKELEIVIGF